MVHTIINAILAILSYVTTSKVLEALRQRRKRRALTTPNYARITELEHELGFTGGPATVDGKIRYRYVNAGPKGIFYRDEDGNITVPPIAKSQYGLTMQEASDALSRAFGPLPVTSAEQAWLDAQCALQADIASELAVSIGPPPGPPNFINKSGPAVIPARCDYSVTGEHEWQTYYLHAQRPGPFHQCRWCGREERVHVTHESFS